MEEVELRHLMHARARAVTSLVRRGHDAFFGGDAIERPPCIGDLDVVDAPAPWVVWDVARWLGFSCVAKRGDVGDSALAESMEIRFKLVEHLGRDTPAQI